VATAGMADKSAADLQKIATAEHQQRHEFNAFILYVTALQLADRGPALQLGIRPDIETGLRGVERPSILEGEAPFTWKFDNSPFKVLNVGPIAVGGKIYLMVAHEVEPWAAEKDVEQNNRQLMAGLAKMYPEYKTAFAGLVVRAHERGGTRAFGTVDELQK
jgi:hypothetical protein